MPIICMIDGIEDIIVHWTWTWPWVAAISDSMAAVYIYILINWVSNIGWFTIYEVDIN